MAKLINRYAAALLEFAQSRGILEKIYRQSLEIAGEKPTVVPGSDTPQEEELLSEELAAFLQFSLQNEVAPVLRRFVEMARERLGIVAVEVISAVPLTPKQLSDLEIKLIRYLKKRVEITTRVEPSILGGLRIIAGGTVIDATIKTQLMELKKSVYKGVYIAQ